MVTLLVYKPHLLPLTLLLIYKTLRLQLKHLASRQVCYLALDSSTLPQQKTPRTSAALAMKSFALIIILMALRTYVIAAPDSGTYRIPL